jgi:homoserine kinase type II
LIDYEERVNVEIIDYIEKKLCTRVYRSVPIRRGLLNFKWVMDTDRGKIFVKQYHPERYKKHRVDRYLQFRVSLALQAGLHEQGIPCPAVHSLNSEHLLQTPSGEYFVVMSYSEGEVVQCGHVTAKQMKELGRVTGRMHRVLNEPDSAGQGDGIIVWVPCLAEMRARWQENWDLAQDKGAEPVLRILDRQKHVLDNMDIGMFADCERGWAHMDLWSDNILFAGDRLTAIVDFDRMSRTYPELDIGRAVLSCVLRGGRLDRDAVSAFAEGYREHRDLLPGGIVRALKLVWCFEFSWWTTWNMAERSLNPRRFAEEMVWVGDHWDELDDIVGDL